MLVKWATGSPFVIRHGMETLAALLDLWEGNPLDTGGQKPSDTGLDDFLC